MSPALLTHRTDSNNPHPKNSRQFFTLRDSLTRWLLHGERLPPTVIPEIDSPAGVGRVAIAAARTRRILRNVGWLWRVRGIAPMAHCLTWHGYSRRRGVCGETTNGELSMCGQGDTESRFGARLRSRH